MKTVSVSQKIKAPVNAVWNLVRAGDGMDRWASFVTSCHLEGKGVGAKRVCVINGQELLESIETVDDNNRIFQYKINKQSLMPIRDIMGTIHLTQISPTETQVLWFVNFDLDDENSFKTIATGIEEMYRVGIKGLEMLASK